MPHGWADDDHDGCNTRKEVLLAESVTPLEVDPRGCKLSGGKWQDRFTGELLENQSQLEIDHLVALGDADRSGGWRWTSERKQQFANDLSSGAHLSAVSSKSNQAKSDHGPDEWLPKNAEARCRYLLDYATIKSTWQLTVTKTQADALHRQWNKC